MFCIGFLYRSNSCPQSSFYNNLQSLINSYYIDLLLEDFNINALDPNTNELVAILSSYCLTVEEIHLDGGLLGHIYVKERTFQCI